MMMIHDACRKHEPRDIRFGQYHRQPLLRLIPECLLSHLPALVTLHSTVMFSSTRRWLKRNRTNFAIGAGVVGVGYVAGQYVINKISETRERMNSDRISREKYVAQIMASE